MIVVTTKKGKPGPPSISYSFSGSFSLRPSYSNKSIHLMNSKERIDYSREIIEKGLTYPTVTNWVGYEGALMDLYNGKISREQFNTEVARLETVNTDWFNGVTENTFSHGHTVNISGGSSNIRYYASVGYSNQNGVIKGENNDRYTATLKLNGSSNRLNYSFSMMGNDSRRDYANPSLNVLDYAYNTSRTIPIYNEDGSLFFTIAPENSLILQPSPYVSISCMKWPTTAIITTPWECH